MRLDGFNNIVEYQEKMSEMNTSPKNLQDEFPRVSRRWHPTKNGSLLPKNVAPNSTLLVWWLCDKCGNEYEKTVHGESRGGCAYCSGKKVYDGNCLAGVMPSVADEWDYSKNTTTPRDVTYGSHDVFWWRCHSCGHSFKRSVNQMTSSKAKRRACGCKVA